MSSIIKSFSDFKGGLLSVLLYYFFTIIITIINIITIIISAPSLNTIIALGKVYHLSQLLQA